MSLTPDTNPARERILGMLLAERGRYVPGERLTAATGLSRAGVWKHISRLRRDGFQVAAGIRKGYRLTQVPDRLLPVLVADGLQTSAVGRRLHYFKKIDSTNRAAKEIALGGTEDGTVVVAEEQAVGRGRMERRWISPAGSSILCSIVFYPEVPTAAIFRLTMLASVAVVRALHRTCGVEAGIKWPNDVYIGGKKVCGILTEFMADHDRVRYVVIGIGINVNFDTRQRTELADIATSLQQACGKDVSRLEVFKALLEELDGLYARFSRTDAAGLRKLWEQHCIVMNQEVKILSDEKTVHGVAKGINENGHLILEDSAGKRQEIVCGDLSLRIKD